MSESDLGLVDVGTSRDSTSSESEINSIHIIKESGEVEQEHETLEETSITDSYPQSSADPDTTQVVAETGIQIANALSPGRLSELEDEDVEIKIEPVDLEVEQVERLSTTRRKRSTLKSSDFVYYGTTSSKQKGFSGTDLDSKPKDKEKAGKHHKNLPAKQNQSNKDQTLCGRRMTLRLRKLDDDTQANKSLPEKISSKETTATLAKYARLQLEEQGTKIIPSIEFPEFDEEESAGSILLEVCIDNYLSIVNAAKGGAKRIELCSSLSEGGLTPTPGLLKMAKATLKIPVFVMIRPRGGDFLYSPEEIEIMTMNIVQYKEMGADGFVFGVLDSKARVDETKCKILMKAADPLPCTFHRAFDMVSQPLRALESVTKLGFSRILTSGQQQSAELGIPYIRQLVRAAGEHITIMAGAGVNPSNVAKIVRETGVKEIHGSARVLVKSEMKRKEKSEVSMGTPGTDDSCYYATDPSIVAQIVKNASDALEPVSE